MSDKQKEIMDKHKVTFSKMMTSEAGSARILADIKKAVAPAPVNLGKAVAAAANKK
jgi:hypothetical protein